MSTGFGLFERATCLQLMKMLRIVKLTLIGISIFLPLLETVTRNLNLVMRNAKARQAVVIA